MAVCASKSLEKININKFLERHWRTWNIGGVGGGGGVVADGYKI
jgi:hypothetical protein